MLDNCEHLPGAAPLLAELLAGCPRLRLLATSRAALRLPPEAAVAIVSLAEAVAGSRAGTIRKPLTVL